jgi:hypothetical protein
VSLSEIGRKRESKARVNPIFGCCDCGSTAKFAAVSIPEAL